MSTTPTPTITGPHRDIVQRAADLFGLIRDAAPAADERRQLDGATIEAINDAGLFGICVPTRFGGHAANVRTLVDTIAEIARADGSAGWVFALMNTSAFIAGLFSDQAQQDVWGEDPDTRLCGVFEAAEQVRHADGGIVLSGAWGFGSGSLHAQWAVLGALLPGDRPQPALALIPIGELTTRDTWHVAGMRGTGSNTILAEEVFVPDHRIMRFADLADGRYATTNTDDALYRSAFMPVATIILSASQIGMAQAALDMTLAALPSRTVKYSTYVYAIDAPTIQIAVAEAASNIDAARLLSDRACTDIDIAATAGSYPSTLARARVRMDTAHTVLLCREAINKLLTVNGASSFGTTNHLQRIWRDSEVASRHSFAQTEIAKEIYGRTLLGIDDPVMPI